MSEVRTALAECQRSQKIQENMSCRMDLGCKTTENSLPDYVILEDTDNGSFPKATDSSSVRGALVSMKARLTIRDVTLELDFLIPAGKVGFWSGKTNTCGST